MKREHRTLIQQWWSAIASVIKEYSTTREGWFDARNEDSVKWARKVAEIPGYMRFI
jgi:hypothetical protein